MAVSNSGEYLAIGWNDNIYIRRMEDFTLLHTLPVQGNVSNLVFSPNDVFLGIVFHSKIEVWDISSFEMVNSFEGSMSSKVSFSSDGQLVITCGGDHTADIWRTGTSLKLVSLPYPNQAGYRWCVFSPDGKSLYLQYGNFSGIGIVIEVWGIETAVSPAP